MSDFAQIESQNKVKTGQSLRNEDKESRIPKDPKGYC